MKRFFNIFLAALTLLATASCNEWLDVSPENDITLEEYWKSKEDIRNALNGSYEQLASQANTLFLWGEIRSGSLAPGAKDDDERTKDYSKLMRLEVLPKNSVNAWGGIYKAINYANTVLKYAPQVRTSDRSLTTKELRAFEAEAYFIRSLSYFYLLRTFRDVPLYLDPTDTDDVDLFLPKSEQRVVLDQIIKDLEWAERYVNQGFEVIEFNKGWATKAAVQALLADVYLWDEQYDKALSMCDKVINRSSHTLIDGDRMDIIFEEGNTHEGIFELQFHKDGGQRNDFKNLFGRKDLLPRVFGSPVIFDQYEDGDPRRILALGASEEGLLVGKYALGSNYEDEGANWVVYRYADILLMKAEALVEKGDFFGAQQELNKVRERAGLGPKIFNGNLREAEDVLLAERSMEFAYEGKRWFDILRFSKRRDYSRQDLLISVLTANVDPTEQARWISLLSDPMSHYLPIHYDEVRSNNLLEQNPYYE
ncbi:membrane protein [Fulvitalea axinellae]|uniref:Membrane protein n=1 Tax=Fulvitalea axinellae TaxID=1182444 RepID=A0AAU9CN92_9BACT|nr:membrane protein [Fulvitalea axinellae]